MNMQINIVVKRSIMMATKKNIYVQYNDSIFDGERYGERKIPLEDYGVYDKKI